MTFPRLRYVQQFEIIDGWPRGPFEVIDTETGRVVASCVHPAAANAAELLLDGECERRLRRSQRGEA